MRELNSAVRPRYFVLFNAGKTVVDIDEISLVSASSTNRISNGGFEAGFDQWFFVSDDHLHWWTKNLPVLILFEAGWVGLLAFSILFLYVLWSLVKATRHGDPLAGVLLASLAGAATIGMTDGVLDVPRNALLFTLLLIASLQCARRRPHRGAVSARDNILMPMGGGQRPPGASTATGARPGA